MIAEIYFGMKASSLLLLSDGIHMFSHILSLGASFLGYYLFRKTQSTQYTFWAAQINALTLTVFAIPLIIEAYSRLVNPTEIQVGTTLWIGTSGLIVNCICAWLLSRSGIEDLNSKSAYLHLLADLLTSIAVIFGVLLFQIFNWTWVDPLLSMTIAVIMVYWGIDLASKSWKLKSIKIHPKLG